MTIVSGVSVRPRWSSALRAARARLPFLAIFLPLDGPLPDHFAYQVRMHSSSSIRGNRPGFPHT